MKRSSLFVLFSGLALAAAMGACGEDASSQPAGGGAAAGADAGGAAQGGAGTAGESAAGQAGAAQGGAGTAGVSAAGQAGAGTAGMSAAGQAGAGTAGMSAAGQAGQAGAGGGQGGAGAGGVSGGAGSGGQVGPVNSCKEAGSTDCFGNPDCADTQLCTNLGTEAIPVPCCATGARGSIPDGAACMLSDECQSGLCVPTSKTGSFCSSTCTKDSDCKAPFAQCISVFGASKFDWCFPKS